MEEGSNDVKNYINYNEILLGRLKLSHFNLMNEMSTVSNRMKEISEIYQQLFAVSGKLGDVK